MRRLVLLAVVLGLAAFAQADAAKAKPAAKAPAVDFAVACSNAYLKVETEKDPVAYAVDEDIVVTVSLAGVSNAVPSGEYSFRWVRTGSDGVTEKGTVAADKKSFKQTIRAAAPAALRFDVEMVDKSGKPFAKVQKKTKVPLCASGGAVVAPGSLMPPAVDAKAEAAYFKELRKRLGRANFRKVVREKVTPASFKVAELYRVELPSPTARPVRVLLTIPTFAEGETARLLPVGLRFEGCGDKPISLPSAAAVSPDEIVLTLAYDPGAPEARNQEFCADLYLELMRAIEYAQSLPEWNGQAIRAVGSGLGAALAVWSAASEERLSNVLVSDLPVSDWGFFALAAQARHIRSRCHVSLPKAPLGGDVKSTVEVVRFWNALACDRALCWYQGGPMVTKWEKLQPVRFVRMDAEHARVEPGIPPPFPDDVEAHFADKLVVEVLVDYAKSTFCADDLKPLDSVRNYASEAYIPFEAYLSIPEKKLKEKLWLAFRCGPQPDGKKKGSDAKPMSLPFPVYQNAGMDLPPPDDYPWFRLVDMQGVLRYSGNNLRKFHEAYQGVVQRLPKPDPVFAYERPELLKETVEKMTKAKLTLGKMCKALEAEAKKTAKTKPERSAEANRLVLGLHRAVERRLMEIRKTLKDRPGLAQLQFHDLMLAWPDLAKDPRAASIGAQLAKNPQAAVMMRLEKTLKQIQDARPTRASDVKKRDAEIAGLRKKLERAVMSRDAATAAEATIMLSELDNPPPQQ